MRKIFYCKECESTYSDEDYKAPTCPTCNIMLLSTDFTESTWNTMSKEEKSKAKVNMSDIPIDVKTYERSENIYMKTDIHNIAKDIHFIKTVVLIYCIFFIIGVIILFLR